MPRKPGPTLPPPTETNGGISKFGILSANS